MNPSIIAEIRDVLSQNVFANDYQVVYISKKIFAKHGYDFISVADRFSCFISKCHAHNIANYSLLLRYSECECSLISVLKNDEAEVVGDLGDLGDTMIFAL